MRVTAVLETSLANLVERYKANDKDVLDQAQIADDFVKDLGAELRYVDGAITAKLPWSLPRPLQALMNRVMPGKVVMLRPQWKYNYGIHIDEIGERYRLQLKNLKPRPDLDEVFASFPALHLVSFPSLERKNALLHCDVGHELGHLIAEDYLASEPTDYLIGFADFVREQSEILQQREALPDLWHQQRMADRFDFLIAARRRGLEEIISDFFGVMLLGPGSLLALLAFASGQRLDTAPSYNTEFYPPWRTRLRLALEFLDRVRPFPFDASPDPASQQVLHRLQERIASIRTLVGDDSDLTVIRGDESTKLAYDSILEAIPRIHKFMADKFGPLVIPMRNLRAEALQLVARLKNGIIPNELHSGSPARLESILNAGWFFRLTYLQPGDQAFDGVDLKTLNRLVLRATELAFIQDEFNARPMRAAAQ